MNPSPSDIRHSFASELKTRCIVRYKRMPSNEQFARDMYLTSKYRLKVSRETVRKWLKGDSFPDLDHLLHLMKWLDLDIAKVFVYETNVIDNVAPRSYMQSLDINAIKNISPDQIDLFVSVLKSIKVAASIERS
jgi:transcriptional regulator with XRE-family HTH domain